MSVSTSSVPAAARELTIRGIVLGGLITLVFTAANVYLGLKVGLTFATAIPAAVISMSVLRYFRNGSVVENNIVQTVASAAGTLSAIIFVLPGLVMIGWWQGFPYWTTSIVCALGGILGVMYSIPLRRALVTGSDLPYPEGLAAAEVLKVGDGGGEDKANREGIRVILHGAAVSTGYSLLASIKLIGSSIAGAIRIGGGGTMFGASLSIALIGVGHLVGLTVGIAMLIGLAISYGALLPMRSVGKLLAGQPLMDSVSQVFASDVRFVGAGAIAVAAIWTLLKIAMPVINGIRGAFKSARARRKGESVDVTERDIPITLVTLVVALTILPIALLLWNFAHGTALHGNMGIVVTSIIYVFTVGLLVAAVCGYMAGLIGSSNSPISGVGILVVICAALLLKLAFGSADAEQSLALIAYTLFTAAVVFGIATISNDNLQDLKTGQLVGATPWKQQVALVIGVLFGAAIIPPVLDLMQTAFGFAGAPGASVNALAAPQAALLSSLATGVFGVSLDWGLLGLGAAIGVGVVIVDEVLRMTTSKYRLPPLAVGMGMYLPMALTLIIPIGAALGHVYDRWSERSAGKQVERRKRMGVLLATGMIVGESLYGVFFAGIVAATGNNEPLAIIEDGFDTWAKILGVLVFSAGISWMYRRTKRAAANDAVENAE